MDCLGIFSKFLAMTTKTTAKATAKTKRMKNNQDAVTANPLGCGSLWKIKNNNYKDETTTATALDCHDLRSRNDKEVENGFVFLWIATKTLRVFSQ